MDTKGKNPEQGNGTGTVSKVGNSTQTDSKDAMEQLLEKTQSFGVSTPHEQLGQELINRNAKCKGTFAVAAAQDNWELLAVKRVIEEAKRDWPGAAGYGYGRAKDR
ncbi:hypothetical protein LZ30DRAFT_822174 [Colletotrichum cereale]|nr:hypothetical protein LZ30DRAFT_822174 [Colletotrichum cereale]